jgi:hypothetical protein
VRAAALYLCAHALVAILGLPVLWLPHVRSWSWRGQLAAAFAVGSVVLALEATALTWLSVSWTMTLLLIAPLCLTALLASTGFPAGSHDESAAAAKAIRAFAIMACGLAFARLAIFLASERATSSDFVLFWGVKAVLFASARGVDPELLRWSYFAHAQPFYPPLVPVLDAASVTIAGDMPWRAAPLETLLWFGATALLLFEILRERIESARAWVATAFWMAALGASLVFSYSGANAEAPLIFYVTGAGALLQTEGVRPGSSRRWLTGLLLAGAVLTKVEGSLGAGLLIVGAALRDSRPTRRISAGALAPLILPPCMAALFWLAYVRWLGIRIEYPGRSHFFAFQGGNLLTVVRDLLENLSAGTHWLAWALPVLFLILAGCSLTREDLPGVALIGGLFVSLVILYLHEPRGLGERMRWEVPRVSQPALSMLIVLATLKTMGQASAVRARRNTNVAWADARVRRDGTLT